MNALLRRCIHLVAASSLFFSMAPAYAADEPRLEPNEVEAARIYRPCLKSSQDNKERCEKRQLLRWQQSQKLTRSNNAYQIYDRYDWGNNHIRKQMQEKRRMTLREKALQRKTFREQPVNPDLDVGDRTYLEGYQAKRLECQLKPRGRARSICLETVAQEMRAASRAAGGSMQYPAK